MIGKKSTANVIWRPQPGPQKALVSCPIFEVFYGGARGGGKTDSMIGGDWPIHAQRYGKHAKGIFFRRELPQLEAAIERSKEIYYQLGAQWFEQKKTWVFPNGSALKFRPLERDSDAEKYQGHDYTRVYFEELTNYPDPKPVMKIKATLRSSHGVPVGFRATGNPGGPGHNWVKERYIDPNPEGYKVLKERGLKRVFIPAKVQDNRILIDNDPDYVNRLQQSGSDNLVKAWLDGDWNIIDGAYFDCWNSNIILDPFKIPENWQRFRSFDWGSAKPFSVGWWAIANDDYDDIPCGSLIRYREWYGKKEANIGLKMTAEGVRDGIIKRESKGECSYGVADPAIFSEDGGPSIAERMMPLHWQPADNKRVAGRGRMGGWDQMRQRMLGGMIYCFKTCYDSIRTIPVLQHDKNKPEDLDTDGEDHAADEWRYACMSRPWVRAEEEKDKPKPKQDYGWDDEESDSWQTA